GFQPEWTARTLSNGPPSLLDKESELVGRLKSILSSSRAIKDMIEVWLVEVGLSPKSRSMAYMVNLDRIKSMPRVLIGRATSMPVEETTIFILEKEHVRAHSSKGKEHVGEVGGEEIAECAQRHRIMRDLCEMEDRAEGDKYFTTRMIELPEAKVDAPLKACWSLLQTSTWFWTDKVSSVEFARGVLNPSLAK
ncbi:hypothetical protein BHE74_00030107, partial [Ensete ventricosum]